MYLSILIPAHNEYHRLPQSLASLLSTKPDHYTLSVLIANDHSTDAQLPELAAHCENTLKHTTLTCSYQLHIETDSPSFYHSSECVEIFFWNNPKPQGKGESLNFLAQNISSFTDKILLIDADLCETAQLSYQLLDVLETTDCDLAIAAFQSQESASTKVEGATSGAVKGFGQVLKLARRELKRAEEQQGRLPARSWISPLSGQRALSYANFQKLKPFASGFGVELIMSLEALRLGMKLQEVELQLSHRYTRRNISGILHRFHQYRDIKAALKRYNKASKHQ